MNTTAHKNADRAAFGLLCIAVLIAGMLFPRGVFAMSGPGTVMTGDVLNKPTQVKTSVEATATRITSVKSLIQQIVQTSNSVAMHFKEFVGDHLATVLAKAALRSITQSIVNWINSGFQGSPSFVTNPEGFLMDVADQTIGAAINYAAPLLCAPFRFDIRLALGLDYSFGGSRDITCRLTDVIANVQGSYEGFVAGNFGAANGWSQWINIAGVPQNNPYGAYLQTVDKIDARIVSATGQEVMQLDFGRGFLSFRECEQYGPDEVVFDKNGAAKTGATPGEVLMRRGPCLKKGPIKTPGSVIEGSLKSAFQSDLMGLAVADEINEIFAALVNQLIKQVFTRGGLVSARNYSQTRYESYQPGSQQSQQTFQTIGVNLGLDDIDTFTREQSDKADRERDSGTFIASSTRSQLAAAKGQTGNAKTEAEDEVNAYTAANLPSEELGVAITTGNLAGSAAGGMPKTARQSSVLTGNIQYAFSPREKDASGHFVAETFVEIPFINRCGPDKGNDGNRDGIFEGTCASGTTGSVVITTHEDNPWWEVDLGEVYTINAVKIYPRRNEAYDRYLKDARIFLTENPFNGGPPPTDGGTVVTLPGSTVTNVAFIEVLLNEGQNKGRYLRLQRSGSGILSFAELEAEQVQGRPETRPIPQFTNLTARLYENYTRTGNPVNVSMGIVSQKITDWQETTPRFPALNGIDGNMNGFGIGENDPSSLVGIINPRWKPGGPELTQCYKSPNLSPDKDPATNDAYLHFYSECQQTNVRFPWWEIDLGRTYNISEIKLWRRTDLPADDVHGLLGSSIFISDNKYTGDADPNWALGIPVEPELCATLRSSGLGCETWEPEPRPYSINLPEIAAKKALEGGGTIPRTGRYLRIQKNSDATTHESSLTLWFSEIQIFVRSGQENAVFQAPTGAAPPAGVVQTATPPPPVAPVEPPAPTGPLITVTNANVDSKRITTSALEVEDITTTFTITNEGTDPVSIQLKTFIREGSDEQKTNFREVLGHLDFKIFADTETNWLERLDWTCTPTSDCFSSVYPIPPSFKAKNDAQATSFSSQGYTLSPGSSRRVEFKVTAHNGSTALNTLFAKKASIITQVLSGGTVVGEQKWSFSN